MGAQPSLSTPPSTRRRSYPDASVSRWIPRLRSLELSLEQVEHVFRSLFEDR